MNATKQSKEAASWNLYQAQIDRARKMLTGEALDTAEDKACDAWMKRAANIRKED